MPVLCDLCPLGEACDRQVTSTETEIVDRQLLTRFCDDKAGYSKVFVDYTDSEEELFHEVESCQGPEGFIKKRWGIIGREVLETHCGIKSISTRGIMPSTLYEFEDLIVNKYRNNQHNLAPLDSGRDNSTVNRVVNSLGYMPGLGIALYGDYVDHTGLALAGFGLMAVYGLGSALSKRLPSRRGDSRIIED